ncbi:hypothetical protein KAX17_17960 [Candidatus Bipolaricaulota bacterium]|nr:hypothetical protein [Candidatus Bipolaricaulota bacterium]
MLKDVPTPCSKEAIPIAKSAWPTTWDVASWVVQRRLSGTMTGAVMRNPARIRRLVGTVVVTATLVAVFVLIPAWTVTGNTALLHSATFGDTPCSPLHVPAALPDGSAVRHSEEWSMEDLAEFWKSLMGWVTEEFEEWNDEWYEEWEDEEDSRCYEGVMREGEEGS